MKNKEFIEFYEKELEKLESHKESLLEIDKSTTYTDKKINHIYDLLTILRNCNKTEVLSEQNTTYKRILWKIERYIEDIEKLKWKNDNEEIERKIDDLLEFLKKVVKEENKC